MSKLNALLRKLADAEAPMTYAEPTEEQKKQILEYIRTTPDIVDTDFHEFVESMGIEPKQAETFVYRTLREVLRSK